MTENNTGIQIKIEPLDEELYNRYAPGADEPGRSWKAVTTMFPDWTHAIFWRNSDDAEWMMFRMGSQAEIENLGENIKDMTGQRMKDREFLARVNSIVSKTQCEGGMRNFG